MNNREKDIENLFRESFADFRMDPSYGLWKRISAKLKWQNFTRFGLNHFNIYYAIGIIAIGLIGVILLTDIKNREIEEEQPASKEKTKNRRSSEDKSKDTLDKEQKTEEIYKLSDEYEKTKPQSETGNLAKTGIIKENKGIPEVGDPGIETDSIHETVRFKKDLSVNAGKDNKITGENKAGNKDDLLIADFSLSQSSGCVSLPVKFTNNSLNAITYLWHFGDGGTSDKKNPKYIYDKPGEYEVILKVTGRREAKAVHFKTVNVYPKPEAQFEIYPKNIELDNEIVNFQNYSKNAVRYEWDFGDSNYSNEIEPAHCYGHYGNYDVKLKAWSDKGCVDSLVIRNAFANSTYMIEFPNAFTPNLNGPGNGYYVRGALNNDVFHPVYKGVIEYQLKIFTKSGQLIFETDDINIGWDGYYKEKLAKQNVYIWKASGRFSNGQPFVKAGDVTLLY